MHFTKVDADLPQVRAAFVGGGFMARVHSRASRAAGARLVGVSSSSALRARTAAEELGVEGSYDSLDDLLADESVDVVHVCTPNSTHAAIVRSIVSAGKSVICEKPLAVSVLEALTLVDEAAAAGVVAAVPFIYRFYPMVREARSRIRNGELGRVLTIQGSYTQDWLLSPDDYDWRVDENIGGPSRAFADIGSHLCDLLEFVLGDRIISLSATTGRAFEHRGQNRAVATEDIVTVIFETERGALGTLMVSQVSPGRKNRLAFEIAGTEASVGFDQEQPETLWLGGRSVSQQLVRSPGALHPEADRLNVLPAGHPQGYQDAFNAFVADVYSGIRSGQLAEGVPTFADGLRATTLTAAVQQSARQLSWMAVGAASSANAERSLSI
ncbi:MAG: Gfo/Idh/MocA family oxidoreductase [Microbacteriaceae bacterium]|jgi:predicted dehydrogenase|nr:Gfo/Idh/MocA family oxidoreductase [Microbacteriaceae bacterium]